MRITRLELNGFRGFSGSEVFDLDADAVILVGANGHGKTSLFDGIMWALTGNVPRLGKEDSQLVSLYSDSGVARVSLTMRTDSGTICHLTRSFDGEQQRLQMVWDGQDYRDAAASTKLLENLWPEALLTPDGFAALTSAFTRSIYLKQDLVREFIEADSEQERFAAVSELVGVGRVRELQLNLEREKSAWTRATNSRLKDGEEVFRMRDTLLDQQERLSQLDQEVEHRVEEVWNDWWSHAREMGVSGQVLPVSDPNAQQALDSAAKQLAVLRRTNDRRAGVAMDLLSEIKAQPEVIDQPELTNFRQTVTSAHQAVTEARNSLTDAQERTAVKRHAQVQLRETREELASLAQLALRHLGDHCPVCTQTYDETVTRRHLEQLISTLDNGEHTSLDEGDEIATLAATLQEREQILRRAEATLQETEDRFRKQQSRLADQSRRLRDLKLENGEKTNLVEQLERLIDDLENKSQDLASQQEQGESLALMLARTTQRTRKAEIERQLPRLILKIIDESFQPC